MRALSIVIAAALIIFAAVEVIAAPGKSIALNGFHYVAPISKIHLATPASMRGFSAELLPE